MRWFALLLASLLLFLLLASQQLGLPGLNYDEVLDAVPAMQSVLGQPVDAVATVTLAGREWPLMIMPYISATTSLWFIPFFATLGATVLSLRLATIVLSLLTLLLLWGFLRDFLDERVAALTLLFLALNPTYVFWSRMGAYVAWPVLPLFIVALWALYRWYRTGRLAPLLVAGAALGFGLNTKILFLWVWVALALAWLFFTPWLAEGAGWQRWLWPLRRSPLGHWLAAGAVAVGGMSMMLLYNLTSGGRTVALVRDNARSTELYGVNNLDLAGNLRVVFFEDFAALLDGRWFHSVLGGTHTNPLGVVAFLAASALLALLAWRGRLPHARRLALLSLLLVAVVAQSAVTITNLGANHLLLVLPIPFILMSSALLAIARLPARGAPLAALLVALLLWGADGATTLRYHRTLAATGGVDYYSDAIYALAADLERADERHPVAMDWGFRRQLQFLSQGRIVTTDQFAYTNEPGVGVMDAINYRVQQAPALYLFNAPDQTAFGGHRALFEEAAYRHQLTPRLWKAYRERSGEVAFEVYALEPRAPRFEAPPLDHPTAIRLEDGISLLGYEGGAVSDGALRLVLYWQSEGQPSQPYKGFAHLLDGEGQVVAQADWIPMMWGYPTTEWQPGEVVEDRLALELPAGMASGSYRLFIGMYHEASGERLALWKEGIPQEGATTELLRVELP